MILLPLVFKEAFDSFRYSFGVGNSVTG